MAPFFMPLLPRGELVQIRKNCPVLEIWRNEQAGAILFYPGSMLAPGHYRLLLTELYIAGFTVAGIHLSGHGACHKKSDFVFNDLLEEGLLAEEWLHANGMGPVAVSGHSQGGMLALAHAGLSHRLAAAFSISAVFPRMREAISLTRFAPFAAARDKILAILRKLAAIAPRFPVPLPLYLSLSRILANRRHPLYMGPGKGRLTYPLKFLVSLFEAPISARPHCPYWLFNARDDALFSENLTKRVFDEIGTSAKSLIWLAGGHMAPLNPDCAAYIARSIAEACASLKFPLNLGTFGQV